MRFSLNKLIDPAKVFLVRKSDVTGRLDPFYFRPEIVALENRVRKVTANRLRDFVVSMAGGATPSTKEAEIHYTDNEDGIPFIRVQNLTTTGRLNLEDCKRITRSTHEGLLARSRLKGGELLVKITGVGRMAVASVVPEAFEGNINQHIVVIRTKDKETSEMIAAFLNLDIAERLASRRSTGGTRPALDYPALLSIPVVFDDRIPKLMHAAVEKFQKRNEEATSLLAKSDDVLLDQLGIPRQPEPLNTIENRIFQIAFSEVTGRRWDPLFHQGDVLYFVRSDKCSLPKLGHLTAYFLTGFAAGRNDQDDEENGIIQIRPTNMSNERDLVFRRNVYITANEVVTRKVDVLKKGEVLFNNTNSQEQVGKTAYFNLDGEYFCSNHITRIATIPDRLNARYLAYVLNLYQRQKVFFRLCTNWNNQSGVGTDILQRLPIPIPLDTTKKDNLTRQAEIVAHLDAIRQQANDLRRQAADDLEKAKRQIEEIILGKESAE